METRNISHTKKELLHKASILKRHARRVISKLERAMQTAKRQQGVYHSQIINKDRGALSKAMRSKAAEILKLSRALTKRAKRSPDESGFMEAEQQQDMEFLASIKPKPKA